MNSIYHLLKNNGLINICNKKAAFPFRDEDKITTQKTKWQLINIGLPIVLTLVLGVLFNYFKKKKYGG